jgi:hypothetical protein
LDGETLGQANAAHAKAAIEAAFMHSLNGGLPGGIIERFYAFNQILLKKIRT